MGPGPVLFDQPTPTPAFFTFDRAAVPAATLQFKPPSSARPVQSYKRRRSVCDVDGEGCSPIQNKKRRLRLDFITSRLSRPYANPSTYIGSPGNCRAARWARSRTVGRISLRKAALVNWTRIRKAVSAHVGSDSPPAVEVGTLAIKDGDDGVMPSGSAHKDRHPYAPPRPSPLGLSNYDALDEEDPFEGFDDDWDDAEEEEVYCDFNIREPEDDPAKAGETPSLDPSSQLFDLSGVCANASVESLLANENNNQGLSFAAFHKALPT